MAVSAMMQKSAQAGGCRLDLDQPTVCLRHPGFWFPI
jgi:hypothetical protein